MSPFTRISVVVPAHNEARFLEGCLEAVRDAATRTEIDVETVVVLNRCTDGTEGIARRHGAVCVPDDSQCIATIRNRGVQAATGDVIVTCDADSRLHRDSLAGALERLGSGQVIGGGMPVRFDRRSAGIRFTETLLDLMVKMTGLPCGGFWTTRDAFQAVSGFDERLPMGEDLDFAKRLLAYGRSVGKRYASLPGCPLLTSSRKFDRFGDWSFLRMMFLDAFRIRRSLRGIDTEFVDEFFYDFNDRK